MTKPLYFYRMAIREARRAFHWYRRRSPQAAAQFRYSLSQAFDDIQASPDRWPLYIEATRVLRLRKFPYLVIFRELAGEIEIVAVAHGHRRPGYWKRRKG